MYKLNKENVRKLFDAISNNGCIDKSKAKSYSMYILDLSIQNKLFYTLLGSRTDVDIRSIVSLNRKGESWKGSIGDIDKMVNIIVTAMIFIGNKEISLTDIYFAESGYRLATHIEDHPEDPFIPMNAFRDFTDENFF